MYDGCSVLSDVDVVVMCIPLVLGHLCLFTELYSLDRSGLSRLHCGYEALDGLLAALQEPHA